MQSTEILKQEHRVIERVLDVLERAVDRLDAGAVVRPAFFLDAADFIGGFADGSHHRKEEDVLFPALLQSGLPPDGGPVAMMLEEHAEGRVFVRAMRNGARLLEAGDASARRALLAGARGYVALLRSHIEKEDEMLFPMADELISPDAQEQIVTAFARVDQAGTGDEARAHYMALAASLEQEAAAWGGG